MKHLIRILSLFAFAAVAAAEPVTPITAENFEKAVGTDWQLAEMTRDGKNAPLEKDAVVTLSFEKTGGIAGNASINRYFGSVKLGDGGALEWSDLGTTRIAGPEGHMKQEAAYLDTLAKTTRMLLEDGKLILETADHSSRLVFTAPK